MTQTTELAGTKLSGKDLERFIAVAKSSGRTLIASSNVPVIGSDEAAKYDYIVAITGQVHGDPTGVVTKDRTGLVDQFFPERRMADQLHRAATADGGPAFPYVTGRVVAQGMSLRDYFAAKAMHAELLSSGSYAASAKALATAALFAGQTIEQRIAFNSYGLADAMLAERAKGGA